MLDRTAAAPAEATAPDAPGPARSDEVAVVVNHKSGRQEQDRLDRISAALSDALGAARVSMRPTPPNRLQDAARAAAQEGAGTVVAAGGDGTIAAVAEAIHGTGARLGVLPMGTFNYFARGLSIPQDLEGAAAVLAAGHERPVAAGLVNRRLFLNNASIGVYPAILRERESIYARFGRSRAAAYWSVLRAMSDYRRPMPLRIEADGETLQLRTPLAFVANSAYQLDLMGIDGADAVRDGKLALLIAPDAPRGELIRRAARLAAGRAERDADYRLIAARKITIEAGRRRRLLARDGERARMRGPYAFHAEPGALRVVAPPERAAAEEGAG